MSKQIILFFLILVMIGPLIACKNTETENTKNADEVVQTDGNEVAQEDGNETVQEDANEVKGDGHESAQDAVNNMLIGWNLGNSFDATGEWLANTSGTNKNFETAWGNPETPDTLMSKLKKLGFNAVRIPITWRYHFDEDGNIDEKWIARVQEVVDWAMEADLYCIINIHHDTGADGWLRATAANYEENAELFAKLWRQIADRFNDYPDRLLFEGFNEMLDDNAEWNNPSAESITAVNNYNQLFVDTVRATGGNNETRNLVCCTYAGSVSDAPITGFKVPEDSVDNHIIGEVHFYTPYEFVTDEGITWTTPISEYSDYVEKSIDSVFSNLKNKMMTKKVPLIIGEFATDDKDNTEDRIKWYTHVIDKANEQNITCFIWDNGNGYSMGQIDRTGDKDAFPEIITKCIEIAK